MHDSTVVFQRSRPGYLIAIERVHAKSFDFYFADQTSRKVLKPSLRWLTAD